MGRSALSRLVHRTVTFGQVACVPYATYHRERKMHPAFQQAIRLLYSRPTKLSLRAIAEHVELKHVASRLQQETGTAILLPTYDQVRKYISVLKEEPKVQKERGGEKGSRRERQSPLSFALSIPAPAQLAQVDEHTMELYVVTKDGIPVASRIHAAVLVCVKTAAIMSAVLSLGPLAEEDYMRLVKGMLEPKDRLVLKAGCQHDWPCYGKPATIFHDRGKIFTSERARQVLVDRLGIITEQAPPYCPSAKGTVESLFRWMTQCFELTLIHKSESTQKNRIIMGSTTAERKHHPYGCVFRPKPLVESFYAQYLWRTLLLFGESLPSHGDGQDFQDSTFVYKCQVLNGVCRTLHLASMMRKRQRRLVQ